MLDWLLGRHTDEPEYDDAGWGRYNQALGDAHNAALAGIAADEAEGRMPPDAAAAERAATHAFTGQNFTFHAGATPLSRADLWPDREDT